MAIKDEQNSIDRGGKEGPLNSDMFKRMVDSANDIFWTMDLDLNFIYVSPSIERFTGYTPEEVMEKGLTGIISKDHITSVLEQLMQGLSDEEDGSSPRDETRRVEVRMPMRSGGEAWGEAIATFLRNDDGEPIGIIGVTRDIEQKKRYEFALEENERKYRTLFENASEVLFIMDGDVFVDCNTSTLRTFGVDTYEEILGLTPGDFSPEYQPNGRRTDELAKEKIHLTLTEGPQRFEWMHSRKDGSLFYADVSLNKLELGDKVLVQAVVRDISEQREARDIIESERNRAEFYLDLLSHDIGNIHQGLQVWTGILELDTDDAQRRGIAVSRIQELAKRSVKLVRNVLLLSRLKEMKKDHMPIDIVPLIMKTKEDMRSLFADRDMDIELISAKEKVEISAEPIIEEAFFNLLHNGVKFQYEDPIRIEITIDVPNDEQIRISFADHGIGISDEKKLQLFDRHISGSDYGYSGIGLSLVKELVTRYQGEVEVKDRIPGDYSRGAKFILTLPKIGKK